MIEQLTPDMLSGRVSAAWGLYRHPDVEQQRVDQALYALGRSAGEWDPATVLVMAAAVNHLYNAGHQRLVQAADHIAEAKRLGLLEPLRDASDIVAAIGRLEPGLSACQHLPFASKFAHFCISREIPLYDRWVAKAVDCHLGEKRCEPDQIYGVFARRVAELHRLAGSPGYREIDWYLWLHGMYQSWRDCCHDDTAVRGLGISRQVRKWFGSDDRRIRNALQGLLGEETSS